MLRRVRLSTWLRALQQDDYRQQQIPHQAGGISYPKQRVGVQFQIAVVLFLQQHG